MGTADDLRTKNNFGLVLLFAACEKGLLRRGAVAACQRRTNGSDDHVDLCVPFSGPKLQRSLANTVLETHVAFMVVITAVTARHSPGSRCALPLLRGYEATLLRSVAGFVGLTTEGTFGRFARPPGSSSSPSAALPRPRMSR